MEKRLSRTPAQEFVNFVRTIKTAIIFDEKGSDKLSCEPCKNRDLLRIFN